MYNRSKIFSSLIQVARYVIILGRQMHLNYFTLGIISFKGIKRCDTLNTFLSGSATLNTLVSL